MHLTNIEASPGAVVPRCADHQVVDTIAVEIEKYEEVDGVRRIHAAVIVDKDAHKAIVIGKGGERLKRVVSDARKDMEKLFGGKVWLETWVKVKSGWADDERALKSLGYE